MNDTPLPPSAPSAELALVAAILRRPELLDALEGIDARDFTTAAPRALLSAALALWRENQPLDIVTCLESLAPATLDACGGLAAFQSVVTAPGSPENAPAYWTAIRSAALSRKLISTLHSAAHDAQDARPQDVAARAARRLDALIAGTDTSGPEPIAVSMDSAVESLRDALNGKPRPVTPTGYSDLDKYLGGGLEGGQLVLIGARPGVGKTSFAAAIAAHVARTGKPSYFVSLEMPAQQLALRLACADSHVNLLRARSAKLDSTEFHRLETAAVQLARAPLYLDYAPGLTLEQLSARARRLKREQGGLGLLALDYLQLVDGEGGKDSRHLELARLSRGLKLLAGQLDVPVLALSQLSREATRQERPGLAHLRDSGGLEADADSVLLLWRNESQGQEHHAEVILAKQRSGPTGVINLHWDAGSAAFRNAAQPWQG